MPPGNPAGYAKAVEVNKAPGDEAGRIRKMMATRPTLNPNQRRSKVRQDLSGASPDGTFVGRGGNVQRFGRAAMSRMPQQPPPDAAAGLSKSFGVLGGDPASDAALQAAQGSGAAPDMPQGPQAMQQPAHLQGQALQDAMARRGMPTGGALPPEAMEMVTRPMPGGPMALEGPGMGGQIDPAAINTALAGAQGAGKGFGPGLPPQIMQRLQALRGARAGGPAGAAPQQRSFQDFWQGGAGGRGNVVY